MFYFLNVIRICFLWLLICSASAGRIRRQDAPKCKDGFECIPLNDCPSIKSLLDDPTPSNLIKVREAICTAIQKNPEVCCEKSGGSVKEKVTTTTENPFITNNNNNNNNNKNFTGEDLLPEHCGRGRGTQTRIIRGLPVPLGSYPWNALLGYNTTGVDLLTPPEEKEPIDWGCGGSLINERYVVTAAHCIVPELVELRLGEHNLDTNPDCTRRAEKEFCAPPHQEFFISEAEIIVHPMYDTRVPFSDDIALIRLDRPVQLNNFVQPICLPNNIINVRSFLRDEEAVVSGWGRTEEGIHARIMRSVTIPYVELDTCQPIYQNSLAPEQICFGGIDKRDSCTGDSGGPVFDTDHNGRNTLIALVSYGKECGGVAAVYTRISSYRDWIIENLRP